MRLMLACAAAALLTPRPAAAQAPPPPQPPDVGFLDVTVLPAPGQEKLYLGRFSEYVPGPPEEYRELHAYATTFPAALDGGFAAGSEVRLLGLSNQSYTFGGSAPAPGGPNAGDAVRVRVDVTDYASGQSGAFEFDARVGLVSGLPSSWFSETTLLASAEASLTLGGSRYTFHVEDGHTESNAWVFATVTVTPAVATPEPTTLALAGVGLVPLLARVARKRTIPCA